MNKTKIGLWGVLVGGLLLLGLTFRAGAYFAAESQTPPPEIKVDFAPFWKVWQVIDDKYVNGQSTSTEAVSDEKRLWGAISGLVGTLDDPYSVFLPPEEKKFFEEDIRGNFGGIGMEIGVEDKILTVIASLPDTPARRAGITSKDRILSINHERATELSVYEAVQKIRGPVGTPVTLEIKREGEAKPLEITLIRETIKIPTLESQIITEDGKKIFWLKLYNFNADAGNDFRQALRQFVLAKTDKLLLDLRGNPGGYLETAVDIASWFLPAGKTVVIEARSEADEAKVYRSKGYNVFNNKLKMVVLVDGGSASASEILAGALSEHDRGTLVGEKTFGKGSVQELVEITPESSLKITVAKWLTPESHSISGNGLVPQIEVKLAPDERASEPGRGQEFDSQVKKAIAVLLGKN